MEISLCIGSAKSPSGLSGFSKKSADGGDAAAAAKVAITSIVA